MDSFNTSYVSVQVKALVCFDSCFIVSIHPMCRFKLLSCATILLRSIVSIHPMCRFKIQSSNVPRLICEVSIHPMCRFKILSGCTKEPVLRFQYILCVGSRPAK